MFKRRYQCYTDGPFLTQKRMPDLKIIFHNVASEYPGTRTSVIRFTFLVVGSGDKTKQEQIDI